MNIRLVERQHQFRIAAKAVTNAWMAFEEIQAIGSVGKSLWKDIPVSNPV